jgi:hypothetical protein
MDVSAKRPYLRPCLLETAQDGISEFAVHLDVAFAGKGIGVALSRRAGVAEQAAEDVGEEVRGAERFP